jgi:hypothetical protein
MAFPNSTYSEDKFEQLLGDIPELRTFGGLPALPAGYTTDGKGTVLPPINVAAVVEEAPPINVAAVVEEAPPLNKPTKYKPVFLREADTKRV